MKKERDLRRSIWITWERQTRNRSASKYLGVPLFEITYGKSSTFVRYVMSSFATLKLIIIRKPKYVFAQNPSVVLSVLVLVCAKLLRFSLIVDAHNTGINYEGRFHRLVNLLNRIVIRNSKFIVVTNEYMANVVSARGGKPLILPDPLPVLPVPKLASVNGFIRSKTDKKLNAFCITSWGEDEPIEALMAAAEMFANSVNFYFTGNYRKASFKISAEALPENVHLLGFVDEDVYFSLLSDCNFTIDLTTRADCLVCGAYESVSAGKPVLLSDTKPQRAYFNRGAVFCSTTCDGIQAGLNEMLSDLDQNQDSIKLLKAEILEREELRRDDFICSITGA